MNYEISLSKGNDVALVQYSGNICHVRGFDTDFFQKHMAEKILDYETVKMVVRLTHTFTNEERVNRARAAQYEKQVEETDANPVPVDTGAAIRLRDIQTKKGAIRTTTSNDISWASILQERIEGARAKAKVASVYIEKGKEVEEIAIFNSYAVASPIYCPKYDKTGFFCSLECVGKCTPF